MNLFQLTLIYKAASFTKKEWPLSKEIFDQLQKHFQSTKREGLPKKTVQLLSKLLKNNTYPEVINEPNVKTLYRGMKLKKEELLKLLKVKEIEDKGHIDFEKDFIVPPTNGFSTSWSVSKKYTKDWSESGKRDFGVTLIAEVKDNPNKFVSGPGGLYDVGLSRWHLEKESVGLEPIKIKRIEWINLAKLDK